MPSSPSTQLKQFALEIANETQERALGLEQELQGLKLRLEQIETQQASARVCGQRVSNFRAQIGRDFQCPSCWVLHETEAALTPVPSDTNDDRFRCIRCGQIVEIEMGTP